MKELYKTLLLNKLINRSKERLLKSISEKIEDDLSDIVYQIKDNKIDLEVLNEKINNINFEIEYKKILKSELEDESIEIV